MFGLGSDGYEANLISTIVDHKRLSVYSYGYEANLISTIVDIKKYKSHYSRL